MRPLSTSPQRQPGKDATSGRRRSRRAMRRDPRIRAAGPGRFEGCGPSRARARRRAGKTAPAGARLGIARVVHSAGIGVDHGRGLVPQLFGHEAEGQEDVRRFKTAHHARHMVFRGQKAVGLQTQNGGDVAGQQKGLHRAGGVVQQARRAGGTSLCRESTQKFSILRRRAVSRVAATVGAVVSKPMPRKTTVSLGLPRPDSGRPGASRRFPRARPGPGHA